MTPKNNAAEELDFNDLMEVEESGIHVVFDSEEGRVCEDCRTVRVGRGHRLCQMCLFQEFRGSDPCSGLHERLYASRTPVPPHKETAGERADLEAIMAEPVVLGFWGNPNSPLRKTPSFIPPRLHPAP